MRDYIWFVRAEPYLLGALGVAGITLGLACAWALVTLYGSKPR